MTIGIIADAVRQPLIYALLVLSSIAGWRMSKLKDGEVDIPKTGFYRGTSKPMRVAAGAVAGVASAVLLRLLADVTDSTVLAYVAVGVMIVNIGVAAGAILFGQVSFVRSGGKWK